MASVIDATVGGISSNSYVTLAEANVYFGDRLQNEAWSNAGATEKNAALLWACRVIDSMMEFNGSKVSESQALSFPRSEVPDPDSGLGNWLSEAAIPKRVKWAQCEMAFALLSGDTTVDPSSEGIASVSVSGVSVQYTSYSKPKVLPRSVLDLLKPLGSYRGGTVMAQLLRA